MALRLAPGHQGVPQQVSPSGWRSIERVSVTNDASGNPVVLMFGCTSDSRYSYVVARRWTGERW